MKDHYIFKTLTYPSIVLKLRMEKSILFVPFQMISVLLFALKIGQYSLNNGETKQWKHWIGESARPTWYINYDFKFFSIPFLSFLKLSPSMRWDGWFNGVLLFGKLCVISWYFHKSENRFLNALFNCSFESWVNCNIF